MHENCDFNKNEGVKRSYLHLRTKTLEKFEEQNDKKGLDLIRRRRTVKKCLKSLKKYEEHVRKDSLKHIQIEIRSVENKLRSIKKKFNQSSINRASIELGRL